LSRAGGSWVAIERVAAAGEWRTNIALGGSRRPATPTPEACVLATYAAAAVAGDLVGVDLLPLPNGHYIVLEVNGAVEFTSDHSLAGRDVFEEVAGAIPPMQPRSGLAGPRSAAEQSHDPVTFVRPDTNFRPEVAICRHFAVIVWATGLGHEVTGTSGETT
jgi:hypothetical protein